MRFSERIGMVPQRQIQENSIDERLRTRIVNYISDNFKSEQAKFVLDKLGLHTYKTDPLSFELSGEVEENIQSLLAYLEGCAWYNVYDAIEMGMDFINFSYCDCCEYDGVDCFYAVDKFGEKVDSPCEHIIQKRQYTEDFNSIFEQEKSAYRFVSGQIVPITNEIELDEIETAASSEFDAVNAHISNALRLYSDRENPDYKNSIKESISAVESMCSVITGTKGKSVTFGAMLKKLEENGVRIHTALREAFSKLYGFTSDEEGIRHGSMDFSNVPAEDAKFMLVACSAFVNYLIEKYGKESK